MILTIEAQFISLIMTVFAGLMIGLLFDLYRTINYYTRPSKAFLYFMDLLFWIITGSVVFVILLNADFAQLRGYTFIGMGVGIFLYLKLFSDYILKLYRLAAYGIGKLLRIIFILITLPFKLFYNLIWTPINIMKKAINRAMEGLSNKTALIVKKFNNKK